MGTEQVIPLGFSCEGYALRVGGDVAFRAPGMLLGREFEWRDRLEVTAHPPRYVNR